MTYGMEKVRIILSFCPDTFLIMILGKDVLGISISFIDPISVKLIKVAISLSRANTHTAKNLVGRIKEALLRAGVQPDDVAFGLSDTTNSAKLLSRLVIKDKSKTLFSNSEVLGLAEHFGQKFKSNCESSESSDDFDKEMNAFFDDMKEKGIDDILANQDVQTTSDSTESRCIMHQMNLVLDYALGKKTRRRGGVPVDEFKVSKELMEKMRRIAKFFRVPQNFHKLQELSPLKPLKFQLDNITRMGGTYLLFKKFIRNSGCLRHYWSVYGTDETMRLSSEVRYV